LAARLLVAGESESAAADAGQGYRRGRPVRQAGVVAAGRSGREIDHGPALHRWVAVAAGAGRHHHSLVEHLTGTVIDGAGAAGEYADFVVRDHGGRTFDLGGAGRIAAVGQAVAVVVLAVEAVALGHPRAIRRGAAEVGLAIGVAGALRLAA